MNPGPSSQAEQEAWGKSQCDFSSKIHLHCEDLGKLFTFFLTVGRRPEAIMFEPFLEQGKVNHSGPGNPPI